MRILEVRNVNRFIVLSFLVMGWTYYELSGGAAFVPETRPELLAEADNQPSSIAETAEELPIVEVVTRAETTTLDELPEAPDTTPEAIALAPATIEEAVPDIEAALVEALEQPASETTTEAAAVVLDLREVTGDQVNLRSGPGREYGVIDKLGQSSVVMVVESGASGWVRVEVERTGLTGWMSEDFLNRIDG